MRPSSSLSILLVAVLSLTLCAESRHYRVLPDEGKNFKNCRRVYKQISRDSRLNINSEFEFVKKWFGFVGVRPSP